MVKKITGLLFLILFSTFPLMAKGQTPADPFKDGASLKQPGIYAKIDTAKGSMIFKLDYKNTPLTVLNFINVVDQGYYNGQTFYRQIKNYALFCGDPNGNSNSGEGYDFSVERNPSISHDGPGVLSMDAVAGMSNSKRFFISLSADPVLDEKYSAFGQLEEGGSILAKIKRDTKISSIEIIKTGSEAKAFKTDMSEYNRLRKQALDNQLTLFKKKNPDVVSAIDALGEGVQKSLTGIYYKITQEGNGTKPASGDTVSVHYVAKMIDGTVFDSSISRGTPFEFKVGTQAVIPGWDEMVLDMSIGEKRTIIIPPNLGYGSVKTGPIPPNSWLVFQVELLEVK